MFTKAKLTMIATDDVSQDGIQPFSIYAKPVTKGGWVIPCSGSQARRMHSLGYQAYHVIATNEEGAIVGSSNKELSHFQFSRKDLEEFVIGEDVVEREVLINTDSSILGNHVVSLTFLKSNWKTQDYIEIFQREPHHNHPIVQDAHGIIRWKENPDVSKCLLRLDLNYLIILLNLLGHDKNSETYRKLYRDMGYSLAGYHEIFYWDVNNLLVDEYVAPKTDSNE